MGAPLAPSLRPPRSYRHLLLPPSVPRSASLYCRPLDPPRTAAGLRPPRRFPASLLLPLSSVLPPPLPLLIITPSSLPPPPPPLPGPRPSTLQGFIRPASRAILIAANTPRELIDALAAYQPPPSLITLASQGALGLHMRG